MKIRSTSQWCRGYIFSVLVSIVQDIDCYCWLNLLLSPRATRFENSAQTRFLWKRTYTLADRQVKGKLLRDCGKLRVKGYVTV